MFNFNQELNYEIMEENYIKDLQELFNEFGEIIILNECENDKSSLECSLFWSFNDKRVKIDIKAEFDKKILYKISLNLEPESIEDTTNYDLDLKLFYHEYIKGRLLDAVNKKKEKFTLRIYKLIYNSTPIYGYYEIHSNCKIAFHSLYIISKDEPLTEHIVGFDIELEERNFERARTLANNTISEFCNFLSVLLDIGFYEPTSKYVNFITTEYNGTCKSYVCKRYRTAFFDPDLKLFIKDNMNGLCPQKEVENKNFLNGYFSISWNDDNKTVQMKTGDLSSIEETFRRHRIYKTNKKSNNTEDYQDEIDAHIHFLNEPIKIPRQIRSYFRGIDEFKRKNLYKYRYFRNACRLYNKSKTIGFDDATTEISFLVASIETLSKTEEKTSFTDFVLKNNPDANRKNLDEMYGIRSKLFHSGSFSFFEYNFEINPYSNPEYVEFQKKYVNFKSVLRKAFINWINSNIVNL